MDIDLNLEHLPVFPRRKDYRIGAIGAGFIMRDIHLVAYRNAGFNVVAISARDIDQARATAELRGIPKVYDTWQELLADDRIEVLDIAVPPAAQSAIVHAALQHKHIHGILAQKPMSTNYREAQEMVTASTRTCVMTIRFVLSRPCCAADIWESPCSPQWICAPSLTGNPGRRIMAK